MTGTTDLKSHLVIDLTTVGRVSGRPHTIEIWFAQHGLTLYLRSCGTKRSDWVRNVIQTPGVQVRVGDRSYPGTARLVTAPHEDRLARDVVHDKYAATSVTSPNGGRTPSPSSSIST